MTGGILEQILAELRELRAEVKQLRAGKPDGSGLVTIAAYAAARSISPSTVRAAIREGRLPKQHVGRAVRVPSDVEIAPRAANENDRDARAARILGLTSARG